jgi:hypothetical protein
MLHFTLATREGELCLSSYLLNLRFAFFIYLFLFLVIFFLCIFLIMFTTFQPLHRLSRGEVNRLGTRVWSWRVSRVQGLAFAAAP